MTSIHQGLGRLLPRSRDGSCSWRLNSSSRGLAQIAHEFVGRTIIQAYLVRTEKCRVHLPLVERIAVFRGTSQSVRTNAFTELCSEVEALKARLSDGGGPLRPTSANSESPRGAAVDLRMLVISCCLTLVKLFVYRLASPT